jgi:hypothetical protein
MIPGTRVTLGEHTYLIPPLNFAAMQLHKDFIADCMEGKMDPANAIRTDFPKMVDIIYLAIRRNYKDLTKETLLEDLDVANMVPAFEAVLKVAGFEASKPGETSPGETLPGVSQT